NGEYLPLDVSPRGQGLQGIVRRVPVGACLLITPFNFPLNLLVHKIGPALACGCPFVVKPSEQAPLTALFLGDLLAKCDLPEGAFSILPIPRDQAGALVPDQRFKLLSFTGSAEVGWRLK